MTHLTPEEDFAMQSPATISADILRGQRDGIWKPLAKKLGWEWSQAHGGYINENYRDRPNTIPSDWDSYDVFETAEDACFKSGVETMAEALDAIAKAGNAA